MIINCPSCGGPVCKGFEELEKVRISFTFSVRCAHCKKDAVVKINFETLIVVNERQMFPKPVEEYKKLRII